MPKYSIILIIIAVILISIAFFNASTIPAQASRDLYFSSNQKNLNLNTREREDMYIQTHAQRRLLQNFYLGASGLICLFAGLIVFPNKNLPSSIE